MQKKIITILGARPQFIKAAPLSRCLRNSDQFQEIIIHTGQHFDPIMSDVFFKELDIDLPKYNLGINCLSHAAMTGKMLEGIEKILEKESPDFVVVYGDTNSTLAGALAAAKMHIPVIHIESGLRSFNKKMPEEINRIVTDHISTFLFCPTHEAIKNLKNENINKNVFHVGDSMYDAVLYAQRKNKSIQYDSMVGDEKYAMLTLHREENIKDKSRLKKIIRYLNKESEKYKIVFFMHPSTSRFINKEEFSSNIIICDPVGYLEMQFYLENAEILYTDSGGLQKEAYCYRVPCVTIRDETEWIETVQNGWNRLWFKEKYLKRKDITEYGDGHAAEKIVGYLSTIASS
jgi:UDP-GlcNAc3NAcA epimerase